MFARKAILIFNRDKYGVKRVCSYCAEARVFSSHFEYHVCFCEQCGSKFIDSFIMGDENGQDLHISQILRFYKNNCKKANKMKMSRFAKKLMEIKH